MSQNVTLLIEVIGLFIAILEVKFPKQAEVLENFIDRSGERFLAYGRKNNNALWVHVFFSVATLLLLVVGIGFIHGVINPELWLWSVFWFFVGPCLYLILIVLLGELIDFLNEFGNGQAITSLGLLIASIGAIIEIVQWIMYL